MNWNDYSSTPLYQQSDDTEKEDLRYRYWKDYLAPNIPEEHHRDARRVFDEKTARRGNPDSSVVGDIGDAFLHGAYQGSADLVSGADRLLGGNGQNAVGDWFHKKAEQQLDDMSPSSGAALQGLHIGDRPDGTFGFSDESTLAGAGLGFVSGLGSLLPSMIPGGAMGKGLSLGGKALAGVGSKTLAAGAGRAANVGTLAEGRAVQGLANTIDKVGQHTGYGLTGGMMLGGAGAEDAKNAMLNRSYEELKDNPRFQELYQRAYEDAGGGDTRLPFQQAKELLAEEAAQAAFLPSAGVGALSMGIGGPAMENIILKNAGTRGANAAKGFMVEGAQEFGEGYGQQMAANYGQQQAGMDIPLTEGALGQAVTGAVIGGPVGGVVGGAFGGVRNPKEISRVQSKLNDLMSQNQTLKDQMQEPHADQDALAEELRQNIMAITSRESWLQHQGEALQAEQAEAEAQPEGWADHHEGYTDPLTGQFNPADPELKTPKSWADNNGRPPEDGGGGGGGIAAGVSDIPNTKPQDFSQYDQPLWQREGPTGGRNPVEAPRFGMRDAKNQRDSKSKQMAVNSQGLRYVDSEAPTNNLERTTNEWRGRTVDPQGRYPGNRSMDSRQGAAVQPDSRLSVNPANQKLPSVNPPQANPDQPADSANPQFQNRAVKPHTNMKPVKVGGKIEPTEPSSYTGNADQDLASYTERVNSMNRLFRSMPWQKGDDSKKRRVRRLIESQRKLEMDARKEGMARTPKGITKPLEILKWMIESGDSEGFNREIAKAEAQVQKGLRLTPQEKSGTPSGKKPVKGKVNEKVSTAERELDTQYALYEADDLIASHSDTGKVNPDYPAELQPRDRSRQASEDQIRGIASKLNPKLLGANPLASSGAPIIGSDRVVESGNGRVSAIRKAYRTHPERAKAYREHLKQNAESFGLTPGGVDGFKQPVLVRQRQGNLDTDQRVAFTKEANARDTASMSATEKAKLDASRITQKDLSHFDTDGTGDLMHRNNNTFLARFADRLGNEAGEMKTRQGDWNKQMRDRVESALFMKAYDDERLNSLFAEDDKPDLKNLIKSLAMAAPHFARAKGVDSELGGYGVIESLVEASRILQDSRNRNQSVDEILDQHSLLDTFSPETEMFARWLDDNLNKSKQVGQALSELASQIEQYLQKQSQAGGDMFGTGEATLDDLIDQTNNQLEKNHGDKNALFPKRIQDPKQQKTEPVQTAEGSNGSGEQEERGGRPADPAPKTERETKRDEVDDLLDDIDDGTLDSDEWSDDDFAGIEEDKPQYDPQDGGSATKRRERDWYNSRNAPHYSVPGFKTLGSPERAAIKRYLDNRSDKQGIVQRLKKLADTPWARKTVQAMLIRQTIDDLVAGREVDYRSLLADKDNASILKALKNHGENGLWRYIHTEELIGHAGKPQNSINGSFVDCLPSRDCASFCYATKGNYRFSNPLIKSEIVNWAVEKDPVRSAKLAAINYKGTAEFYQEKALRLFDMGDGSMEWLPFIKQMNKEGIRLQIFSKNPEFLKQVPELNWRALSVDNSNFELAAQHPDLPLAVVFDGHKNGIDFIRSNLGRILVILPIKQGQKVLSNKASLRRMLGIDAMKKVCPIDGGWKKIKHPTDPKKDFNCTSCDKYGGAGCYQGNVTSKVMKAAAENPHEKNIRELKEDIENEPERYGGKESATELAGNLGKILSAIRASVDPRTEEGNEEVSKDKAGRTIPIRQVDERGGKYDPHGRGKSRRAQERERDETGEVNDERDTGEPRVVKLRGRKRDPSVSGQRDLFASPDLSGEQRKQQIVQNQRVLVKHVETGTIRVGTDTLKDVRDVGHFIAPIRKLAQEEMYAIVLDANDKVINVIKHSKGQKSQATVSSWTLAGAIVATPEAKSVWFAHNHPSGEATPSQSDQAITWHLNDVLDGSGVVNNGHVVVAKDRSYHALDADGQMQGVFQAKALPRKQAVAVTERQLRMNNPKFQVSSPATAKPLLDAISPNALVLLNTQHKITGILPLSDSDLSTLRFPGDPAVVRILKALDSTNSTKVIIKTGNSTKEMKAARNLTRFFNRADSIQVLDHFYAKGDGYQSGAETGSDLGESGPFYARRNDKAKGVQSGPLRLKLRPLEKEHGQAIHVLQSESELPSHLYREVMKDKALGRVRGMYDPATGETYLIANNLDNAADAVRAVLHETVGHKGVRAVLGKRLDTVLDQVHRDMSGKLKEALAKRYARQLEGMGKEEGHRLIAEEYLAHLAETDPKNGLLTKIISMIRNALRRLFPNIKWSDADAVQLLAAARRKLKQDGAGPNGGSPKKQGNRYSDADKAPTFYSAVERGAAAVKSDKLPAQSWLNAIKKSNNVQDEEIQWMGLDLWLDSKKGEKLSKEDVLGFIRENEVKIEEDLTMSDTAANEEELEERLDRMRSNFLEDRIGDYEHGYHLDEIQDLLDTAREELYDSEYEYYYDDLKQRFEDEALDDHEVESLVDEDGDLDESALVEEASNQANIAVEHTSQREIATDHVSYSEKHEAAMEVWEDERESDTRSDLESEMQDESGVQYREYAMAGGEDYSELILTLEDNRTIFPSDPDHKNENPLTPEEIETLNTGSMPKDLLVFEAYSGDAHSWTVARYAHKNEQTIITTGHATEASAIAAALSESQPYTQWGVDSYTHSHWGDMGNPLAHVRFQTFDENVYGRNERILFIDEVQSDWHQAGRDKGYQTPENAKEHEKQDRKERGITREINTLTKEESIIVNELYRAKDKRNELNEQLDNETGWNDWGDEEYKGKLQTETDQTIKDITELTNRKAKVEDEIKRLETERQSMYGKRTNIHRMVPDAPLKENWPNLIMKRMIRHAAENGYDRIAWTSAVQQVERYPSIGQVVSELKVSPQLTKDVAVKGFDLTVKDRNGRTRSMVAPEATLEDYIGNRLAEQAREKTKTVQEDLKQERSQWSAEQDKDDEQQRWFIRDANGEAQYSFSGGLLYFDSSAEANQEIDQAVFAEHSEEFTLEGMNEVVGEDGKGMREFYDKRLANYMKKYTKKWGAKLEPIGMNFKEQGYPWDTKADKVWSVTVTDKMKDSVLKDGQPLFSLKNDALKDKKQDKKQDKKLKPDNSPRYALKDNLPDDVRQVINDIHGATQPKSPTERFKEWWDFKRVLRQVDQGIFNPAAAIEHNEKLLNDGKLLDASLSASKAFFLTRNLDNVMEVMLHEGTPVLEDGSVVINPDSKGLLDVVHPVAERSELEVWETWAGSIRAERIMAEDKAARAKGNQLLAQGHALKEALDSIAPDEYSGGRSAWNRDRKQSNRDLKEGKDLSQQNRENLYDDKKIKTIQNWVNTQPQLKARFNKVKDDYQAHNKDLLDFLVDAGLVDRDVRKLWETDDYLPFNRVHDLEAKEDKGRFIKRGVSGQKSGIQKLTGGVEKISPLEAMVRNTRSMMDAAFKNIAQQRIVEDGVAVGALEEIDAAIRITDEDVISKLQEMDQDTNLTPEQMKRWKALMAKYSVLGEGTTSVSVNGKLKTYMVNDPLLLASIQDLGAPTHSTLMKLVGVPRKVLTKAVTALPDFMFRNIFKDTISTAVHIAPEVSGKPLSLNPLAGAVRGFRQSLKNDKTRWTMMMGGGSGSGYYNLSHKNIRKKLSPDEQKRLISRPGQLLDFWHQFGSRFENSNRLHVYDQVIKQGGSPAEAAYQSMDVLNFTRSGQWPIIQFMVQSLPFFNSHLQGLNRMWRGAKPGDKLNLASFSASVLIRGLGYGLAAWALMRHYEDDERYKKLSNHDKLGYHHFWIGEGEDGHYRIPKPFEVGGIFATLPEIITQSLDGNEDMKWTRDMLKGLVMNTFALDPIPQLIKPIWEVSENRDRFRDKSIIPMRLQNLKPEAQYDPYTSDTLKELAQLLPEGTPAMLRSPKKLEHLLKGYFGSLGGYVLMAADAVTREATDAAERPSLRKRDYPLLGSFVRDGVGGSNRYTDELHDMSQDVEAIAASIKRYQESGEHGRAKELEQSSADKLRNQKGMRKSSRELSKLRKELRRVYEDKLMGKDTKRQRVDALERKINQTSAEAVKRYQKPFR